MERYFRTVGATAQLGPGGDPGDDGKATRTQDLETLNVTFVQVRYNVVFVLAFVTVDALTFYEFVQDDTIRLCSWARTPGSQAAPRRVKLRSFCTMMGFPTSAVDVGRDWWVDEARTRRPRWRVWSTNLDGTDTDEENIEGEGNMEAMGVYALARHWTNRQGAY